MSTRSAIIMKRGDNDFAGIYCHFDGYPDHVGVVLRDSYNSSDKAAALIALGDISSLGNKIEGSDGHSFANREPDVTVAYARDRGESDVEAKTGASIEEVAKQIGHNGYVYLFADGAWTCNGKSIDDSLKADEDDS